MKKLFYLKTILCFALFICILPLTQAIAEEREPNLLMAKITEGTDVPAERGALDRNNAGIQAAISAQGRHTSSLMSAADVVGTAVGLTWDGRPAVIVLTKKEPGYGTIPGSLDGIPVVTLTTGEFLAMARSKPGVNTTARFDRPVPIGISTGNEGECSAGTIGARVKKGADVYALSNNHVYALENNAAIGSNVLQPGRYDTGCAYNAANIIGTLADFEPIVFSTEASNKIDAAIALSSASLLGNSTPSGGYGTPKSVAVTEALGLSVQKYGRTTKLTKGTIVGINAVINIGYDSGVARFVDQIIINSGKPFVKAGDSGSLIVTDDHSPVGLLFAGNTSGGYGIANPIRHVLERFSATVDGK